MWADAVVLQATAKKYGETFDDLTSFLKFLIFELNYNLKLPVYQFYHKNRYELIVF